MEGRSGFRITRNVEIISGESPTSALSYSAITAGFIGILAVATLSRVDIYGLGGPRGSVRAPESGALIRIEVRAECPARQANFYLQTNWRKHRQPACQDSCRPFESYEQTGISRSRCAASRLG